MQVRRKSTVTKIALVFARVTRIVMTFLLAAAVIASFTWFAMQWFEGKRVAKSIGLQSAPQTATAPTVFRPGDVVGRIQVPRLGLDSPLIEMADVDDMANLDKGPAHIARTALPGQTGNCVIAGHRTTHSHPFLHLDQMRAGDQVILIDTAGKANTYTVTGLLIVEPRDVSVIAPTPGPSVTLIACHPPFSAKHRLIVKAAMNTAAP